MEWVKRKIKKHRKQGGFMHITPQDARAMAIVTKTVPKFYLGRLDKVRIRPNEIAATDSTIAVIRQLPPRDGEKEEQFEECFVNPTNLVNAVFTAGELNANDYFMITFTTPANQDTPPVSIPKEEVQYVDIEKVTPSKKRPGQQMATFNPKKMIQCLRAIEDADFVEFRIAGQNKAVRMDAYWYGSNKRAVAVIMPLTQVQTDS